MSRILKVFFWAHLSCLIIITLGCLIGFTWLVTVIDLSLLDLSAFLGFFPGVAVLVWAIGFLILRGVEAIRDKHHPWLDRMDFIELSEKLHIPLVIMAILAILSILSNLYLPRFMGQFDQILIIIGVVVSMVMVVMVTFLSYLMSRFLDLKMAKWEFVYEIDIIMDKFTFLRKMFKKI